MTTPTGEYWTSLNEINPSNIRKQLYGSLLIRDWQGDGSTDLSSFTPFTSDGNLRTDLLTPVSAGGQGWFDVGALSESGVDLDPKITTDPTKIWQSRFTQRTDITEDDESLMFTAMESSPLVDYLRNNLPLADVPLLGSANYSVVKPNQPDTVYRQILVIGVDGSQASGYEYTAEIRPRTALSKVGKRSWNAKKTDDVEFTFDVFPDPISGFARATKRDGAAWAAAGALLAVTWPSPQTAPVATALTGGRATVQLAPPASLNDPFTYQVNAYSGTPATSAPVPSTVLASTTSSVTLQVSSGLTTGTAYTFTVTATGASGGVSPESEQSNSVTAIA